MKMKLKYRYISFKKVKSGGVAYTMHNKKSDAFMGNVFYNEQSKGFVIEIMGGGGWQLDIKCLQDMTDFMGRLNKEKKDG